tara:strand:+ start:7974 stop:8273 length:300 start_codon:yes stop_codon:yes gene_type:complete
MSKLFKLNADQQKWADWAEFFKGATVKTKSGKFNWELTGMMFEYNNPRAIMKRTIITRHGDRMTQRATIDPSRLQLSDGPTETEKEWTLGADTPSRIRM